MRFILLVLTFLAGMATTAAEGFAAEQCPRAAQCRETPPEGKLIHKANSAGNRIWTSPCGPNTFPSSDDQICLEIAACPQAGAFGKFLKAVSGQCKQKHFNGYFGLDGLTFGILDWTSSSIPGVLKAHEARSPSEYQRLFGTLPTKNGCVDTAWVCKANREAAFMCDSALREIFTSALATSDFRKAQMDYALKQYEVRLKRYESLALKTEYGNTAMAVLANNLKRTNACKPSVWKAACSKKPTEREVVDCMLQKYIDGTCRGSIRGSRERVKVIKALFEGESESTIIHPKISEVEQCVTNWSR